MRQPGRECRDTERRVRATLATEGLYVPSRKAVNVIDGENPESSAEIWNGPRPTIDPSEWIWNNDSYPLAPERAIPENGAPSDH
jgi:hypothetical protein